MSNFEGLESSGSDNPDEDVSSPDSTAEIASEVPPAEKINIAGYLYNKNFNCPVCDADFASTVIKSGKARFLSSDTDLKPLYRPFDPTYYDIVVCRNCGYAALVSVFRKITSSQCNKVLTEIKPKYVDKDYPMILTTDMAIERHKLALHTSFAKGGSNGEKGFICLKIAWLYRDLADDENEKFFIKHAYTKLKEAYSTDSFPIFGMDEAQLTYLIGELARRVGNYSESLRWISKVVLMKNVNSRLKEKADDIRNLLRDELKQGETEI